MSLVIVLVRHGRLAQQGSHSYKYSGGILNTAASRGRGYYVRRCDGQNQGEVVKKLKFQKV